MRRLKIHLRDTSSNVVITLENPRLSQIGIFPISDTIVKDLTHVLINTGLVCVSLCLVKASLATKTDYC